MFRKGDVVEWDPEFHNISSGTYRKDWGPGPFIVQENAWGPEDVVYGPDRSIHRVAWAKRFKRNEFLTAASKAVALSTIDNRSDKEKEI
jgi:hypothetical protein